MTCHGYKDLRVLRPHNLYCALVIGCALFPISLCARDAAARPRILVANFGSTDSLKSEAAAQAPALSSELKREFATLETGVSGGSVGGSSTREKFLRVPITRVPAWMRSGAAPTRPFQDVAKGPSTSDLCAPRPYTPSSLLGRSAEQRRRVLYPLVQSAACAAGLPVGLMDAMLIQESRYNPLAISPKGAFGLGQLMPRTALQLGVDRYDLGDNLTGAARYLRQHIDEFGQIPLALAAYNAGPARVRRSWSVPRITETQNYVRQILINWRSIEAAAAARDTSREKPGARQIALISKFP